MKSLLLKELEALGLILKEGECSCKYWWLPGLIPSEREGQRRAEAGEPIKQPCPSCKPEPREKP